MCPPNFLKVNKLLKKFLLYKLEQNNRESDLQIPYFR